MRLYNEIAAFVNADLPVNIICDLTGVKETDVNLVAENMALESKMKAEGASRYIERQEGMAERGKATETDVVMKRIRQLTKPVAAAIRATIVNYKGKRPRADVEFFKRHVPEELAIYAARTLIHRVTNEKEQLAAALMAMMQSIEPDIKPEDAMRAGFKLMKLLCDNSEGHFYITKRNMGGANAVYVMGMDESFMEWEQTNMATSAELHLLSRPMVVPPKPWTSLRDGGYYSIPKDLVRNAPRIPDGKGGWMPSVTLRTHGPKAIPMVYAAINKAQATPFKVNPFILKVANQLGDHEHEYKNPLRFKGFFESIPERPFKTRLKTLLENQESILTKMQAREKAGKDGQRDFKAWLRHYLKEVVKEGHPDYGLKIDLEKVRFDIVQFMKWKKAYTSATSKNRVIACAMGAANDYAKYKAFWFPMSYDYRFRMYPMTSGLTPQGNGFQKAMLLYAQGKPVKTQEALDIFSVAIANFFGHDKKSRQFRLKWTRDNRELIERVGRDPIKNKEDWMHTDEPWLFLAACEQMCRVYDHGLDAMLDVNCPVDGTCSGAQHYAMMTRDVQGAYAVNVLPNGTQGVQSKLSALRAELGIENPTNRTVSLLSIDQNDQLLQLVGETV